MISGGIVTPPDRRPPEKRKQPVVPALREDWSVDPWALLERDGWFYGRGTTDNKAGAAMLVANVVRLKREGWRPRRDLIIAFTGDEETTQASIQWLLKEHRALVDAGFALNTDSGRIILKDGKPSLFTVQASEKIYADYQLEVTDVGGHSSLARPDNPIYTLAAALQRIAAHQFPLNVTEIARVFFERSARVETGQVAADMRAVAAPSPDSAAAARLSMQPFYNARLRTTCVATRVDAGHANNALPHSRQSKRVHVVGKAADDLGTQCGGWTISGQGETGAVTTGGTTILAAILAGQYGRRMPRLPLQGAGDPAALPLLLGVGLSVLLLTAPIQHAISRAFEREADEASLELTDKTDAFIRAEVALARANRADLIPPAWAVFWFYTHPPVLERIGMGEAFRPELPAFQPGG